MHAVVKLCWRVSQHAPWRPLPSYPLRRRLLAASSSLPRRRLLAASSPPRRLTRMQADIASAHVVHVQIPNFQLFMSKMSTTMCLSRVHSCVSRLCVFLPYDFKLYIIMLCLESAMSLAGAQCITACTLPRVPCPDSRNQVQPVSNSARHRMRKQGERGGAELRLALS